MKELEYEYKKTEEDKQIKRELEDIYVESRKNLIIEGLRGIYKVKRKKIKEILDDIKELRKIYLG